MNFLGWTVEYLPTFGGLLIALFVVILISLFATNKKNGFAILFGQAYEGMTDFFADILEDRTDYWTTSYITNMFFVIWLYNLLGLLFDFVSPIFGYSETLEEFNISQYLGFATSDHHFNIAMATLGVIIMLGLQFSKMRGDGAIGKKISQAKWNTPFFKLFNFIYEYIPFWGKGIITVEKGNMNPILFYPLWIVIKAFDIVISVFVGFLDIVGLVAKIISLAFRLYGNMLSGTALLTVLVVGLSATTEKWFGTALPIIAPIVLFAQGLLVATVQAFVFPLLIAIFLKVARMNDEEATA